MRNLPQSLGHALRQQTGLTEPKIRQILRTLLGDGLVEAEGEGRHTHRPLGCCGGQGPQLPLRDPEQLGHLADLHAGAA